MANNKIASLRISKGINQSELARKAEISRSYLIAVEKGTSVPTVEVGSRIANALGVTLDDIFLPRVSDMNDSAE
ncbi:helix-turn-helix transcriptional regulator [Lentilactobacillus parabuchneri]|uniref:helix-turn-helix transcriptional regulator n=1 Tax=Lentilactobacillus parabuchneri TaxID=152331 RepID=UPI000A264995|nr:helix-turn-helix domain-containing protein [Lentilactobacillus parabuchneri]ORN13316.1 anaerobic benzoate catabolism transcriptional regulator [Lentilactobacillus parabuchneri]ORN14971.1 anaerobic benzoate catabolism transcriptional regulator [Lentilactobacillus parabuchneri]ORN18737.1 anaerobic benzoate catabolism transcriptional regulator [Lentilactobacillus parabuchneri]ORN23939.1 anaerobic benzoate catabolism transcriptional regulator [Lentilactobacillus parabuchneri]